MNAPCRAHSSVVERCPAVSELIRGWFLNICASMPVRAHSSVVERCPDKTEALGPIPSAPTDEVALVHMFRRQS